jgi:hypothetical protein
LGSRKYIQQEQIEETAIQKYRSNGNGITFRDIMTEFSISKKSNAQRMLKFSHAKDILFTGNDLISEGIGLLTNTNPQQYFPSTIKAEIVENLSKRKNVLVNPTGVIPSKHPLSNTLEAQKAQNFLDILVQLHFAPTYIHKLLLMLSIYKEYYTTLERKSEPINKAKIYQELIGRTLTTYTYSPNGTVEIAVACSDNPFRLETDDDVAILFSFFGQVRDRMLYHLSDLRERIVPPIIDWCLKQCDVNKDIEITDKMQFTLPDIQFRYAGRVFRAYVKVLGEKAAFRCEESLKVDLNLMDGIHYAKDPDKVLERKLDYLIDLVKANNTLIQ